MKVLLVGNYRFDGSTSMRIWAAALHRELGAAGIDVRLIAPRPFFGACIPSAHGLGKWLGYIDRFILFPRRLRAAAARADLVHLCDHGSAVYVPFVERAPVLITCHDMIAVRAARGEIPELRASRFGKILQRWICSGLRRATRVACVSRATFDDVRAILQSDSNLSVVLNGLNYPFQPLAPDEAGRRLAQFGVLRSPFILHLGSNLPYKNRAGVLRVFAKASAGTDLQLVLAGEPLDRGLVRLARALGIHHRIVAIVNPRVEVIEALYSRALCLLFPSLYEGFGWPPIEAQACGCPVVASNIAPFAETLEQSALLASPGDEDGLAGAVRRLLADPGLCRLMRQRGLQNVRARFLTARMIRDYLALYRDLAGAAATPPMESL